uniref:Putative Short-chain dehydrogenase/reductase n=1 Tax=Magnetococcus massalia (strain MO-1) TaxID=451514 RepID=A0A1S7LLF5_MAGMO|nr:Putative Short-chain dehydrogenase/reductase [Candidatus Magnetococcus massalia]
MEEYEMSQAAGIILVSGGSRGLGLAICRDLLEAGERVVAFSRRSTDEAEALKQAFPEHFHFLEADLSAKGSMGTLVQQVEEIGSIAALINNAAVAPDGLLATMDEADVGRTLDINVTGTLALTKQVIRRMMLRKRGRIINISSVIGQRGFSGLVAYAASKAAIEGATRALAREVGRAGITVNAIAPGYLETEMSEGLGDTQRQQIIRRTPLGRLGEVGDITGTVRFFLSKEAGFITGQTLIIDGGMSS